MVSDALALALSQAGDTDVVGRAATLGEAIARVEACRPDVVILDRWGAR
jgi:DNA-binding NarL/FixJ family response regulator